MSQVLKAEENLFLLLTPDELLQDLEGLLCAIAPPLPCGPIKGFSIDTRTLLPGDVFLAIRGDHTDGHLYLKTAFEKGASLALVEKSSGIGQDIPCLEVSHMLSALQALARGARKRISQASLIALTGSVGKTGTKEVLFHVLSLFGKTHRSVASFNNHWGVPLSLARMHRENLFGIFEMGMNHAGEITPLTQLVRPHIALITRIGAAHKGFFSSPEGIAEAKAEIFKGIEKGGGALLNHDDPFFSFLKSQAQACGVTSFLSFGQHVSADVRLLSVTLENDSSLLEVECCGVYLRGRLAYPGEHWVSNALGVLAVCQVLGLPLKECMEAFETLPELEGRGRRVTVSWQGEPITFLDESYNANPTSMRAALGVLAQQKQATRRVAVLGDMLELGETEVQDHKDLLEVVPSTVDLVFTCGPLMRHLHEILPVGQKGEWGEDVQALLPRLQASLQRGDVVMIKGSRGMKLEKILRGCA